MEEGASSPAPGDIPPEARVAALAFPKLNFHLDDFLFIGAVNAAPGAVEGAANAADAGCGLTGGIKGLGALSKGVGIAYIETGSYGRDLREDAPEADVVDEPDHADRPDCFDVLLISRASDCEATARVASVSSFGVVGVATPLPFLAPRFLRL
jgi:hypothetical protein